VQTFFTPKPIKINHFCQYLKLLQRNKNFKLFSLFSRITAFHHHFAFITFNTPTSSPFRAAGHPLFPAAPALFLSINQPRPHPVFQAQPAKQILITHWPQPLTTTHL
jgi:hypothetical protein